MAVTMHRRGTKEIVDELVSRLEMVLIGAELFDGSLYTEFGGDVPVPTVAGRDYVFTGVDGVSCSNDGVNVPSGSRFTAGAAAVVSMAAQGLEASVRECGFGRVALFDSEDLVSAFRFLTVTEERVCIVVPLTETFERMEGTRNLKWVWKRVLPVAVLMSEGVLGDRRAALWGSEDEEEDVIGAMGLMELALPVCVGLLLANPNGVVSEPRSSSVMVVRDTEKDLAGRVAVALELECKGGWIEETLPRGPIV